MDNIRVNLNLVEYGIVNEYVDRAVSADIEFLNQKTLRVNMYEDGRFMNAFVLFRRDCGGYDSRIFWSVVIMLEKKGLLPRGKAYELADNWETSHNESKSTKEGEMSREREILEVVVDFCDSQLEYLQKAERYISNYISNKFDPRIEISDDEIKGAARELAEFLDGDYGALGLYDEEGEEILEILNGIAGG